MSDKQFFYGIFGGLFSVILICMVGAIVVCNIDKRNRYKEDRILQNSEGRTIKSCKQDGSTLIIHYENGGGFTVKGYKGLKIE